MPLPFLWLLEFPSSLLDGACLPPFSEQCKQQDSGHHEQDQQCEVVGRIQLLVVAVLRMCSCCQLDSSLSSFRSLTFLIVFPFIFEPAMMTLSYVLNLSDFPFCYCFLLKTTKKSFYFVLECNGLTMLLQFQMNTKGIQPSI